MSKPEVSLEDYQQIKKLQKDLDMSHRYTNALESRISELEKELNKARVQHGAKIDSAEILDRLNGALRQYRHNNDNTGTLDKPEQGFVFGYDKHEIDELVADLVNFRAQHGAGAGQWIPCSERLPIGGYYLAFRPDAPPCNRIATIQYDSYMGTWSGQFTVTHYMDLPQPPQGEE